MEQENVNRRDTIDVKSLLRAYKKNWFWFVISAIVCVGLAFTYTRIHKPMYQFNANILISKGDGDMTSFIPDMGAFSNLLGAKNSVDDELLLLSSHSLMTQLVKDMELDRVHTERRGPFGLLKKFAYPDYALDVVTMTPEFTDTLSAVLQFNVKVSSKGSATVNLKAGKKLIGKYESQSLPMTMNTIYGDFTLQPTKDFEKGKGYNYLIKIINAGARADGILATMSIDMASKKSSVVNIAMRHNNAEYAIDLINNLMDAYNAKGLTDKANRGDKTLSFVDERIRLVADSLAIVENEIKEYMTLNGLGDAEGELKLAYEMKGALEKALLEARSRTEVLGMLRDFLRNPANNYSLIPATEAAGTEAIAAYNTLVLERMQLEQNAKGDNKVLASLNSRIDAMRQSILESVDKAYESARITQNEISSKSSATDTRLSHAPALARDLVSLERDQLLKQKIFAYLVQQREQTAMQVANAIPKGTIIDRAYSGTEPLGLSTKMWLLIALFAGLCIPPTVIFGIRFFGKRIDRMGKLMSVTQLPVAATLPQIETGSLVATPANADTKAMEQVRILRSAVVRELAGVDKRIILVTSGGRGDGRTFVAANLAGALAMTGRKTVLVDFDLRQPSVAKLMGVPNRPGVANYIDCNATVGEIVTGSGSNLSVIPAGSSDNHPAELMVNDRVGVLLDTLAGEYGYVVVDAPQLTGISDALALAAYAAMTLAVCRLDHSTVKDIETIDRMVSEGKLNNVAIVAIDPENA